MEKGLTVAKWMLIVWPKIPQMPQNLSAQFVCPGPKVLDFNEKRLHWASVVRAPGICSKFYESVTLIKDLINIYGHIILIQASMYTH